MAIFMLRVWYLNLHHALAFGRRHPEHLRPIFSPDLFRTLLRTPGDNAPALTRRHLDLKNYMLSGFVKATLKTRLTHFFCVLMPLVI